MDWKPTPEQDAEIRRKAKAYHDYLEDYFKGWREMPDKGDLDRARKEYQQLLKKQENEAKNRN